MLSVWFSLAAWSLQAAGWPQRAIPEPIAEVYVDSELFTRWVIPSQLVSLAVTGRPAFRRVEVHGALHVVERVLVPRPGVAPDAGDEERFEVRPRLRLMRRRDGNVVEPQTLIRRFGADALRLGYLLSVHGTQEQATAAESHLRRARRTVRRLGSKVTGLFHLTRDNEGEAVSQLADRWILARADRAVEAALTAYREHRLPAAGHLLNAAVDDLARYAAVAAGRRRREVGLGSIRPTVTAAVARLAEGFAPVCPYIFEKLVDWTRQQGLLAGSELPAAAEPAAWLVDLVDHLDGGRGPARVGSTQAEVLELLDRDREDLAELTRVEVEVAGEPGSGEVAAVGPCFVVRGGGT